MGKPRRPRSRPTGTHQPLQAVPDAPESRAAAAPSPADRPAPATDHPVEAAAPPAEPVRVGAEAVDAVMPEAAPDGAPRASAETAPDGAVAVPSDPVAEAAAASATEAAIDIALPPAPAAGPGLAATANRIAFVPDRLDVVEIGSTIARYVRGEGEAALAHLRALSGARSPADVIRLQVGEVQRAADASLTCWVAVVGQASRAVAYR